MKRFLIVFFCLLLPVAAFAQDSTSSSEANPADAKPLATPQAAQEPTPAASGKDAPERMFFPKDWYWGWAQFDLAPPHNEVDPNLCAANAGNYGGTNAQCNAFARYMLSGTFEARPFGRTIARRLMFFFDPNFTFGKNVPQYLYTWSWKAIGMEYAYGVGVDLPKQFEFRFTAHPLMVRIGSRDQYLGPAYLGPNGPWGRYNTFGVRKYFGTRRVPE
jgi:hypothetical protein